MHYAGWDIHQRFSEITAMEEDGKGIKRFRVPHQAGVFNSPQIKELLRMIAHFPFYSDS